MYGFKKGEPLSYYLEGVIAMAAMMLNLTFFILDDQSLDGHIDKTYVIVRGAGMLLFNLIELVMLIPIRTIGISPKFRNHFKKKNKKKYLRTFRWMCFLNLCNITYSLLFITDEFREILYIYKVESSIQMRFAFVLSFGSVYFSIWALSQLLPWIIPSEVEKDTLYTYNPGIDQTSEISYMTQYAQVDKSRLGINGSNHDNSSYISPVASNLTIDSNKWLLKSQNNKNKNQSQGHKNQSFDGDLSSLKVIESKSPKSSSNGKDNKSRKVFKEREPEINYYQNGDEDGMGSSLGVTDKYDDVIKMFKKDSDDQSNVLLNQDNDNVNQLDKVKSFAHNYNNQ